MRYLFDHWEQAAWRIRTANDIRLYLDFDGTLVAFEANPDQVKLREKTRAALRRLAKHRRVHVAIVSGRRRAELEKLLNARSVEFMGLYGWEDKSRKPLPARTITSLAEARKILGGLAKEMPGIFLEDKGISVAVHFRNTSAAFQRRAKMRVRKIVDGFRRDLHVMRSSTAWDVVPVEVKGKGIALRNALARVRKPFLAIYAGDDITDEPAFKELSKGITVLVGGPRKTHAQFRLSDSLEVYTFLRLLEAELL
jgi:trehalose 6-phosphate phosphatase